MSQVAHFINYYVLSPQELISQESHTSGWDSYNQWQEIVRSNVWECADDTEHWPRGRIFVLH